MHFVRLLLCLSALSLMFGCTHQLEIKNLNQYQASSLTTLPKDFSIGVATSNTEQTGKTLVTGVAEGLCKYTGNLVYPFYPGSSRPVDLIANVNVHPEYHGSGWNFLINFPGFLIWTPAWNGYVYRPSYNTDIELLRGSDGARLDAFSLPIALDVRHAEFDRTWTEISWLEFGVIALLGGVVFTQYDPDVTPPLECAIREPVGGYIAQEIAGRLRNARYLDEILQQKAGAQPGSAATAAP
jgi:hypothetical protein